MVISRLHGNREMVTRGVWPFRWSARDALDMDLWKGLVGAWVTSLGVTGTGSNAILDLSPYRYHATTNNLTASSWVIGRNGYMLDYIPTSSMYLSVPDGGHLEGFSEFTAATWTIWEGGGGGDSTDGVLHRKGNTTLFLVDSTHKLGAWVFTGIWRGADVIGATSINDGKLHHVAVTWDKNADITVYLDGKVDGVNSSTYGVVSSDTSTFYIGRQETNKYFDGKIGDYYLWNRKLNISEINKLYTDPHALFRTRQYEIGEGSVPAGGRITKNTDAYPLGINVGMSRRMPRNIGVFN